MRSVKSRSPDASLNPKEESDECGVEEEVAEAEEAVHERRPQKSLILPRNWLGPVQQWLQMCPWPMARPDHGSSLQASDNVTLKVCPRKDPIMFTHDADSSVESAKSVVLGRESAVLRSEVIIGLRATSRLRQLFSISSGIQC